MSSKIAKVVVGLPVDGPFDYAVDRSFRDRIAVGARVRVSFNRQNRVGFVVGSAGRSTFKHLNPILSVLDEAPVLNGCAFELAKAFSGYYGCSLGEAIETFLPKALRNDKSSSSSIIPTGPIKKASPLKQKHILIHDQTRSQRWPLIVQHIQKCIDQSKRVIVLVPEVSFIKDTVKRLSELLSCPIAVFDKKLSPKKELEQWEQIRNGEFSVIVGTRSAVFAPLPDLGLIVIDEEENDSYKQEQVPHYHVHEVALMRSKIDQCRLILVSSLPNAETWDQAKKDKWEKLVIRSEQSPQVQMIDMNNYNPRKTSIISFPLQSAIQKTLDEQGQIILFMNRLGFSTQTHCQQCGHILRCARCNVNLTFLYSQKILACRHCNTKKKLPKICPECKGGYLRSIGTGIEKLESDAARLYPNARIHLYDRQSKVFPKEADIIITTQAILRRHDDWTVALTAMLNFDAQLYRADFRSGQKALALLMHLNQLTKEKLLIQTRMMDSYCIKAIRAKDFNKFYREELKLRRELELPPFKHLVALGLRGKKEETVFELSTDLFNKLDKTKPKGIEISDPHPDARPKLRDQFRFTIIIKGGSVKSALAHVKATLKGFRKRGIIITINVDP